MAKFMIKASEFKNVCKAVNDRKLAELKKEIIEILKKQDENEFKKATDYLNSQEEHFTHLEKSLSGKWIEKAGYGVGTVRIWKGKKYKKIAPGKWARVFDKEGRGTNIAIGKLIAKVQKIDNVEDLMAFVMANKQRFVDENGMDLPVLDKLRAAVGVKNENLSGESSSYTYGVGENVSREKNKIFESKEKITKEEADLHKVSRKFEQIPTTELKQRKAKLERWIENKTRNKRDSLNNAIFRESYQKELDAINEVLDKRNTKKEDKPAEKKTVDYSKMSEDELKELNSKLHDKLKEKDYDEVDEEMEQINAIGKQQAINFYKTKEKHTLQHVDDVEQKKKMIADSKAITEKELAKKEKQKEKETNIAKKNNLVDEIKELKHKISAFEQLANEIEDEPADNRESRMNGLKDEIEFYAGVADENGKLSKEQVKGLKEALENLYVFGNRVVNNDFLRGVKALEENGGKFSDEEISKKAKETEDVDPRTGKENYWIIDSRGNRLTNKDAIKRIQDNLARIDELENSDEPRKDMKIKDLKFDNEYLKDRLNPDDRKESEAEKHQNRSEAMKGNQNAKKYGLTDEQIERYDIQEVVEDVNGYGIVKNSEGKYSFIEDGKVRDRPEDFETSIEKVKERINDAYETKKNIEAANNYNFKNADFGADVKYQKLPDGKHEYYKKTPDGKALSVKVKISDMREPLNMTYEITDVKSGKGWQYETAYGNKENLEWAVERPEQMEKEIKKFFKRDPNKEWDKMNSDIKPQNDVYAPSESTNLETKKAIAENKSIGENEVQMPYSKELEDEMKALKNYTNQIDDDRYISMRHIYYDNGNLVATDGRRLKVIKVGELDGIPNGTYVDINSSKEGINIKKVDGLDAYQFPKYTRVIPDNLSQKVTLNNKVIKNKIKEMKKDGAIDKNLNSRIQLEFKDGKVYLDDTEVGDAKNINLYADTGDWGNPQKEPTNFVTINADFLDNALTGNSSTLMLGDRADKAIGISTDSTTNILMPMNGATAKIDYSESRKAKADEKEKKEREKEENRKANKARIEDSMNRTNFEEAVDKAANDVDNWLKKDDDFLKKTYERMNFNLDKELGRKRFMSVGDNVSKELGLTVWSAYMHNKLAEKHPEVKEKIEKELEKRGISVKKSLFDGFLGLELLEEDIDDIEEEKEEESLWNDYSAEQPELFNSVELQVCEAMNRHYSNCL